MLMWYYLIQNKLLTQFGMKVCFINYSSTKLTTGFGLFYVIIILVSRCSVKICGIQSFWFDIKQGVHQGGVFSNGLYQLCIDILLTELSTDCIPVWMYGIQCHYIMSADDFALIGLVVAHIQQNLSIVVRHRRKWRYRHKACKSLFLVQGRTANKNAVV